MERKQIIVYILSFSLFFFIGCEKKETIPPMPMPHHITFDTSDAVTIYANYYQPDKPAPVLILLHMYGRTKETWKPAIPYWHNKGFAIVNIDIRGHGDSIKQGNKTIRYSYPKKPEDNLFLQAWKDVQAAIGYLEKYKSKRCRTDKIILVGASIGCSIALHCGTKLKNIKGAVLMSPGLNYLGVNSLEHITKFYPKPLLFVSDEKELSACERLINAGGYSTEDLLFFPQAGHGTLMFESKNSIKIIKKIGNWLENNFIAEKN
ncbi:alpha/beta hydrolase [bacterium]|nr:alpha/beta hydrolase [bacterium]